MVWFCACTAGNRENSVPVQLKLAMTTDFRKADPTYTNFTPASAEEAINKFHRHKSLGVPPHLWPEVFVECAANLPLPELHKFQEWLVNPQGEPQGPMLTQVDQANEAERLQLLKEATARDALQQTVPEEPLNIVEDFWGSPNDVDDEKVDVSSMMHNLSVTESDFEMVTPSSR